MKVAIITEGYQGTGYGHLTRCLSIYQAFEEKGIIPLYIANCDEVGKRFIPNVNLLQLNWVENTNKLINQIKDFDIAIIDSYLAPIENYEQIYRNVKTSAYIDDYLRITYPKGTVINGTIGAEKLPYEQDKKNDFLLGVKYIPLRKEFWDLNPKIDTEKTDNVLITFGGSELKDIVINIINKLLISYPELVYNVVIGNNSNAKMNNYDPHRVKFHYSLSANEMRDLMRKCNIAISAAGQTSYELNRLGKVSILIGVAENQKYNLAGWQETEFIKNQLWYNEERLIDKILDQFDSFIKYYGKNRQLVTNVLADGQGARRIVEKLIKI